MLSFHLSESFSGIKMGIETYWVSGFEIKRVTKVDDNAGSYTEQLSKVSDTVGRLRPLSGNEILANEKLNLITSHRFYCPVIDVNEGDYIYDTVKPRLFEVKYVRNPMDMDEHLEIDCLFKKDHQEFTPVPEPDPEE